MMHVKNLGLQPYTEILEQMKQFTTRRSLATVDELWLLEHPPVYTQGQAGKPEHILNSSSISIVQSDRGGQVTYHGPGQLVAYLLMDINRRKLGIRSLVCQLEQLIIQLLKKYSIQAEEHCGAPGVYVADRKIASIGLRVKNGCTYHGIALNVNMDLSPFSGINPCGFKHMQMTQISDFQSEATVAQVSCDLSQLFLAHFNRDLL